MTGFAFALHKASIGVVISNELAMTLTPGYATEPSPFNLPETLIAFSGGNLPSLFEPSGILWHSSLQRLLIVNDGGLLAIVDSEGEKCRYLAAG